MTKEQMSAELDKAKVELEQLRKDDKQREDELTAVTMARMLAGNKTAAEVLDELFEFDADGYCLGFNERAVAWHVWKAAEPK